METDSGNTANGLVDRVKGILLKPAETWPVVAAEPSSPGDIIARYALPLIAIGPIAAFIGGQIFGYGAFGFTYRPGLMAGLSGAVVQFVASLVALIVVALIADFLAPKFGGQANRTQAFKWVAYAATASWVGGVFGLVPSLGVLAILASLYSLYLFYTGAAPVMKVPQDKALAYTAVTVLAAILLMFVVSAVTTSVAGLFGGGLRGGGIGAIDRDGEITGSLNIPGVGSIDTQRLEEATKRMEQMADGEIKALTPAQLSPLLPTSVGAYSRVATSSTGTGVGSRAEATYESGDRRFDLSVTDMAAMGGFAAIASAMGVEHSEEDADGYERVYRDGDSMVTEEWNRPDSRGSYGIVVGDRFMVQAEGQAASIDELKAAVSSVNAGELARLTN